ncbi:serine/threonine-protein kinase/endoribonuclease IRE1 [Thrips palmi]|uniref:non-specific serine/threonine protein kinase n=1 Tax=Thrips palmi TaxID=161013 RepID=A0A6P8Z9W5_THRPL|nr:serine/threonine-protein kinase/endoribonuclease IRE1 [Thrips palmi]
MHGHSCLRMTLQEGNMKLGMVLLTIFFALARVTATTSPLATPSTSLVREYQDDRLLLLSTLDGSLYAVDRLTGITQWQLKDEPVVKVPVDASKAVTPIFLPDPKDGSLYVLGGSEREALKKLPFTIPQLVAQSPCRSSDGILYTGKKMDTWFSVNSKTGEKQPVLSSDGQHVCPLTDSNGNSFYIGRTEYNIIMLDSKQKERKWNVTFFDYSANTMDSELLSNYEMVHFMGSSSGRVITMDRRTHRHLWSSNYGSPVIGVYLLDTEGLISCPFTSVAEETLDALADQLKSTAPSTWLSSDQMKLKSTLYVGEHPFGLYALPSLVDQSVATVNHLNFGALLIEGPNEGSTAGNVGDSTQHNPGSSNLKDLQSNLDNVLPARKDIDVTPSYPLIILGHYQTPSFSEAIVPDGQKTSAMIPLPRHVVNFDWELENETGEHSHEDNRGPHSPKPVSPQVKTTPNSDISCWDEVIRGNFSTVLTPECIQFMYSGLKIWVTQQENKSLKIAMALIIISMAALFCYVRGKMREIHQMSQSSHSGKVESFTQPSELHGRGVCVGKITFFTAEVLGKGCEGTFVYRGLFDGRNVAVKRLLPECFSLADREVALLRESDQHANVIRYFCTEQDHLFRYIALELAAATLADLVEGRIVLGSTDLPARLTTTEIIRQATSGMAHLHSLDIVHRDIKPQNVLLSVPNAHGEVRAMISDFGLCKKLQKGRMSFSRRSGITGTDGWIAPEMLSGSGRTTCAVDVFSMGCVLYYVKTSGKHPFGDPLRRQANILSGEPRLNDLNSSQLDQLLTGTLVKCMLSWEPLERPPAEAVLSHPLFWSRAKIMSFFQDVSDRVEKDEPATSTALQALEADGARVVRGDWRVHISDEVAQDLRRYRNYRGLSVRDLLRALRNKKHHYRELSLEAQRSLGTIPDQFVMYWMDRFPRLLLHSWLAMQIVRHEPVFKPYYHISHTFPPSQVSIAADNDWESTVTLDAVDFNTVTWQNLKDKSSPKSKKKLPGNSKKTFSGKESPKKDPRTNQRDDQVDWRRRDVINDKSAAKSAENWRCEHRRLNGEEDNLNQDMGVNSPLPKVLEKETLNKKA